MAEIHPLSAERHGDKQFLAQKTWSFVAQQQLAPVLCSEFSHAACEYPLVFSGKPEQLSPCVLLGIQPGINLQVNSQGEWAGQYIPAFFRGYPFVSVKIAEDKDEFAFCIDESGGHLINSGGVSLFTKDGAKSPFLQRTYNFIREYRQQIPAGMKLCKLLQGFGLLAPLNIELRDRKGNRVDKVSELFRVDEKKLAELSGESFLELREAGVLPLIYAQLLSMRHLKRMLELQENVARASAPLEETLPESFSF